MRKQPSFTAGEQSSGGARLTEATRPEVPGGRQRSAPAEVSDHLAVRWCHINIHGKMSHNSTLTTAIQCSYYTFTMLVVSK